MKVQILVFIFLGLSLTLLGQNSNEVLKGSVSYVSSQNVYVKFANTDGIHIGDTLFVLSNNKSIPVLIVNSLSSISCVGTLIGETKLTTSTEIITKRKIYTKSIEVVAQQSTEAISVNELAAKTSLKETKTDNYKARFDGKLSLSSYTNVSNYTSNQRFRYNLSLNAQHISNSKLSFESYVNFTHKMSFPAKTNDWEGINNALKIYSLALTYDLSKTSRLSLGRKINNNMANIGAVDGLQYEKTSKNFTYGALVGSRPDYSDYSFNPNLLQFGAFMSHSMQKEAGNIQTSVAVFNQMNNFITDRRFAYLQHTNSLLKNVDLFCSAEIDFYTMENLQPKNTFDLTSTYISVRYKPWKVFNMSLSYDARKNIYYYETFKNTIDSILDRETRQGLRFQTMLRPFKYFIWGTNAGTRFQAGVSPSLNANSFMSYSKLPFDISATLTASAFKSNYTNGTVFGGSLARDFVDGKVNAEVEYRMANYTYNNSPTTNLQNIAEMSLYWRLAKKLTLSVNFEVTLENDIDGLPNNSGRAFINISQRF